VQLLVDNRSDSTKMHGATIRFIANSVIEQELLTRVSRKFVSQITQTHTGADATLQKQNNKWQ